MVAPPLELQNSWAVSRLRQSAVRGSSGPSSSSRSTKRWRASSSVFTFGSTGDLLPFLSLARGLRARGHEVTLSAPSVYEAKVASTGVPFRRLGPPFDPAFVTALMESAIELRDPIAQIDKVFAEGVCRGAEETFRDAVEAVEASDLVVTNITGAPAMAAAEAVGVPLITGVLNHGLVPSAHHGFPGGTEASRKHRQLLLEAMEGAGFKRNKMEWWHYDLPGARKLPVLDVPFTQQK